MGRLYYMWVERGYIYQHEDVIHPKYPLFYYAVLVSG